MKVAFILSSKQKVGIFMMVQNLVNQLVTMTDTIDIYYLKNVDCELSFKARSIKIGFFDKVNFEQYDIVHSHGFFADFYASLNRKYIKGKFVSTLHQCVEPDYSMLYGKPVGFLLEKMWCYLLRKSDSIITLTNDMVLYYKGKIHNSDKLNYIHNGIELPLINNLCDSVEKEHLLRLKQQYKIIGISASLIYRKGIDQVINCLSLPENADKALIILGQGNEKASLIELSRKLQVENRCFFLGFKEHPLDFFFLFDIYVMSSRSEGFGLCVLEAASQRIPIVCSNLPVYHEIFSADEVEYFDIDNISSLSLSINNILKEKSRFSHKIFEAYYNQFTAKKMAENYLSCYKKLLKF